MSTSYRQIFKATSLIGGAQVVRLAIGVLQVKALALLLGPAGIGLAGLYQSAVSLIGTVTGLGISSAGVRQIAEAAATGDEDRLARTVITLRRTSFVSGLLGSLVVAVFATPLSLATFGTSDHAWGVAAVGTTLLFSNIAAGQAALLQGLRRIGELAQCGIAGAVFGAGASVVAVTVLGERGVACYLVAAACFAVLPSWWFARRIPVKRVAVTTSLVLGEARALIGMGLAFVISGLMVAVAAYVTRVLVNDRMGMGAVGIYSATVNLASLYVNVILNAMGADFYPRLTAVAQDNATTNKMVNEQAEIGTIIALPGVLMTLTLAPWVLRLFYSEPFVAGSDLLRWQILGVALRVLSWPLGFIVLAKGMARTFMTMEGLSNAAHVILTAAGLFVWGLEGAGIAFFAMYVCYFSMALFVCRHVSGFRWSRTSVCLIGMTVAMVGGLFVCTRCLPEEIVLIIGIALSLAASVLGLWWLSHALGLPVWGLVPGRLLGRLSPPKQR